MNGVVYFIDDDPNILTAYARIVRSANIPARAFSSVESFIHSDIGHESPGCIVCDIQMPGIGGFELPGLAARKGLRLPIIYVAADDSPRNRRTASELGAVAFFRKPVDAQLLLKVVLDAIEQPQQRPRL